MWNQYSDLPLKAYEALDEKFYHLGYPDWHEHWVWLCELGTRWRPRWEYNVPGEAGKR